MTRSTPARIALVVAVLAACGWAAVRAAPDGGRGVGLWPVGLATGLLLLTRGRRLPLAAAAVLGIAAATIWTGRPSDVALGYGAGIAAEAVVVWWLLTRGSLAEPALLGDGELRRYLLACGAGGAVGAATGALTSVVADWGDPGEVALVLGAGHLASQLAVVPFFLRLPDHLAAAGPLERAGQWATILVVTPLVFLPQDFPSLVFLAIPVLVWGAFRVTSWEAMAQLVAVLAFAIWMTTFGRGPFADALREQDLGPDARGVLLAGYAATCALVVVPLLVRVGQQVGTARLAAAERDRLRNVVAGTHGVAIVGTDDRGRITLFNPGAERLLGYAAEEVLGRPALALHTGEAIAAKAAELGVEDDVQAVVRAMAQAGESSELRYLRKDGEERTHATTMARIADERGGLLGYVSTSEDVTDRLLTQAALEEAVERLREVDAAKDAFVSTVSHELRTPITSIRGYLELLEDGSYGDLGPQQRDALRRVMDNSDRLLTLIDDLLTLQRLQGGAGPQRGDRPFDLRDVVQAGFASATDGAAPRRLRTDLDLPPGPVRLTGDPDLVQRVVADLVGNAVKFTPDGGSVAVSLQVDGDHAELAVRDTGIGIPAAEQPLVFTRFFRSDLARRRAVQGTGLGLAIARTVVEEHGGSIAVESWEGVGSTFRVRLPVTA